MRKKEVPAEDAFPPSSKQQPPDGPRGHMAGPCLSPLLILLLSLALGAAGLEANNTGERIINGFLCPKGKQPWQVALFDGHKFHCSGVLLSELWVLTVAHCHLREYTVQMGSDILLHGDVQRIRATKSFIHPRFSGVTHVNDLMLVKLSAPAPLSSTVKIISVSSQCKPPGTKCTVSGWGSIAMDIVTYPKALMCSQVSIYPYMYCKRTFPTISRRYMTCAAPPNRLSYMCKEVAVELTDARSPTPFVNDWPLKMMLQGIIPPHW
ncbi:kallikrein-7-like [Phyllostomus discolor]|uniref:Kallikrein-7-like n=1 Tax=Phyllostomus discolor TaxID=89673 RepID=A0A6J2N3X8_9CHIR|nr:kallikrein-7-like [Phyllostomus discolor]